MLKWISGFYLTLKSYEVTKDQKIKMKIPFKYNDKNIFLSFNFKIFKETRLRVGMFLIIINN